MKVIKTASGKKQIKISKKEWQSIGKKAGWMRKAQYEDQEGDKADKIYDEYFDFFKELHIKANRGLTVMDYSSFQGEGAGMLFEDIKNLVNVTSDNIKSINKGPEPDIIPQEAVDQFLDEEGR